MSCHLCKSRKTTPIAGRAAPGTAGDTSQPSPTEPVTLAQVLFPAELVTVRRVELSQQEHPCQRNCIYTGSSPVVTSLRKTPDIVYEAAVLSTETGQLSI